MRFATCIGWILFRSQTYSFYLELNPSNNGIRDMIEGKLAIHITSAFIHVVTIFEILSVSLIIITTTIIIKN